jgi:hypothetical protein
LWFVVTKGTTRDELEPMRLYNAAGVSLDAELRYPPGIVLNPPLPTTKAILPLSEARAPNFDILYREILMFHVNNRENGKNCEFPCLDYAL